ncbi:MAG: esterase family protein [Bifidobacteriaceae bacterium]|nr:esterase family protein [Bifidobacteriaceae bacterium]
MSNIAAIGGRPGHGIGLAEPTEYSPHRDFFATIPFAIVLVAVGAALLATAIWLLRKRHRRIKARRTLRWISYTAGALSVVLGLAVGANWYAGWLPNFDAVRMRLGWGDSSRPESRVAANAPKTEHLGEEAITGTHVPLATPSPMNDPEQANIKGSTSEFQLPVEADLNLESPAVWVYTPPGYDSTGKVAYPVVYLMHGSPGGPVDWIASGAPNVFDDLIKSGALAPIIAVAPTVSARGASDSGCLNSTKSGGSQVETFLYKVVKPWIENHFPVSTDRAATAIGGMSMGGYCSIDQALRHPDQFSTVLSQMPYGGPGKAGDLMKSSKAEVAAVTPLEYIPTLTTLDKDPLAVWFDVPDSEETGQVGKEANAMAKALRERGQLVDVYVAPNQGHTWKMAIATLPMGLEFWQGQLNKID